MRAPASCWPPPAPPGRRRSSSSGAGPSRPPCRVRRGPRRSDRPSRGSAACRWRTWAACSCCCARSARRAGRGPPRVRPRGRRGRRASPITSRWCRRCSRRLLDGRRRPLGVPDDPGRRRPPLAGPPRRPARAGAHVVETYGLTGDLRRGRLRRPAPRKPAAERPGPRGLSSSPARRLMRGYRRPGGHAAAFTEDGWLRPGDAGEHRRRGRLTSCGVGSTTGSTPAARRCGPRRSRPRSATIPGVAEVAVGGGPTPEWGERVVAFVVPAHCRPGRRRSRSCATTRRSGSPGSRPRASSCSC